MFVSQHCALLFTSFKHILTTTQQLQNFMACSLPDECMVFAVRRTKDQLVVILSATGCAHDKKLHTCLPGCMRLTKYTSTFKVAAA